MKMKLLIGCAVLGLLAACERPADVASRNLSYDADNFRITRRVVFYNGITDTYMLEITGRCSLGNADDAGELTITCQTGPAEYKKHFLGLSDNVTYFVEQLEARDVSTFHYQVAFRPQSILPDIDFQGNADDMKQNRN